MEDFIQKNHKLLIFILLGLILIGFGVLTYKINIFSSGDIVEVLNSTTESQNTTSNGNQEIIVEISGSVENPGVYKLKIGDRIDDLLVISGGLSLNADRDWVTKNVNRAAKLIDGQKYYIYHSGELTAKDEGGIKLDQGVLGSKTQNSNGLININTGSQSELEKLVGIGPVYALNIIEHRPYSNTEELLTKDILKKNVYEKIKNSITAN